MREVHYDGSHLVDAHDFASFLLDAFNSDLAGCIDHEPVLLLFVAESFLHSFWAESPSDPEELQEEGALYRHAEIVGKKKMETLNGALLYLTRKLSTTCTSNALCCFRFALCLVLFYCVS